MLAGINLLAQLGILVALLVGVLYVKRLKFSIHGYLAFVAVVLSLTSIILVMLPSVSGILGSSSQPLRSITAIHSILGIVTEVVGVYIVWIWRFRRPGGSCSRMRNYMRPLVAVWMITLILGVLMYNNIYGGL
jgi:uncharacterized membrane protein YozB (DUF420 family)